MHKFLAKHKVDRLLVMGLNTESLEFCEAFHKEFPETKITVMDLNK